MDRNVVKKYLEKTEERKEKKTKNAEDKRSKEITKRRHDEDVPEEITINQISDRIAGKHLSIKEVVNYLFDDLGISEDDIIWTVSQLYQRNLLKGNSFSITTVERLADKALSRKLKEGTGLNWISVGDKYMMHQRKFGKGIIDIRYKSNRHTVPNLSPFQASEDMKRAIQSLVDNKKHDTSVQLDPGEISVVKHIAGLFGVGSDQLHDTSAERWELIKGSLLSTSRPSNELKKEARGFLQSALRLKKITKQEFDLLEKELGI